MTHKEYTLSPEEYQNYIENLELKNIYLESCTAKVNKNNQDYPQEISINSKTSYKNLENEIAEVRRKYTLTSYKEKKSNFGVKISAEYVLIYHTKREFSEDFFEIFKNLNVPLNIWPYFREFVQNMVARMDLPNLTLPLKK